MLKRFKNIKIMVAIAILLMVIAGCVGPKEPDTRFGFEAKAATGLFITHGGGDPVILNNEKITVKKLVNDKVVDGLNGVALNSSEFQAEPVSEKLVAGQKIKHVWKEPLMLGDVLTITIMDVPSGKIIVDTKVTVS